MKVLKNGIDKDAWLKQYLLATKDCWECPCCGEVNREPLAQDPISQIDSRHIRDKDMWVDIFRCDKCKAEWESSPYYDSDHFRSLKERTKFIGSPPCI